MLFVDNIAQVGRAARELASLDVYRADYRRRVEWDGRGVYLRGLAGCAAVNRIIYRAAGAELKAHALDAVIHTGLDAGHRLRRDAARAARVIRADGSGGKIEKAVFTGHPPVAAAVFYPAQRRVIAESAVCGAEIQAVALRVEREGRIASGRVAAAGTVDDVDSAGGERFVGQAVHGAILSVVGEVIVAEPQLLRGDVFQLHPVVQAAVVAPVPLVVDHGLVYHEGRGALAARLKRGKAVGAVLEAGGRIFGRRDAVAVTA